jgi:Leucine rich repeat
MCVEHLFHTHTCSIHSDVSFNPLAGAFPQALSAWAARVVPGRIGVECGIVTAGACQSSLHASSNTFYGSIPEGLLSAPGLQLIDLSNNFFHGDLSAVRPGTALTELDVSYNNLVGIIPDALAGLAQLRVLDVSQNFLSGDVPWVNISRKQQRMAFLDFSSSSGNRRIVQCPVNAASRL